MSGGVDHESTENGDGGTASSKGVESAGSEDAESTDDAATSSGKTRKLSAKTHRAREWVLLDGNRLVVAGVVLAILLAVLLAVERAGLVPLETQQPVFYVFGGFIGGNLTLITVVVSINQLLLGRELSSPGTLESQIQSVIDYREEVEDAAGQVAPVKPLGFLELLVQNTRREAQRLGGMTFGAVDSEVREEVDETVESLTDQLDRVIELLQESDANTFDVLSVTLTTNYAEDINRIRRIRANYGDDLPGTAMDALANLVENLQRVDVARQYFKSVYLQEELSSLSRLLLYAGFPAETAAVVALLALSAESETVLIEYRQLLIPVAITVGFLPLALLFAFILRTATVIERTAATIPFTTPRQER